MQLFVETSSKGIKILEKVPFKSEDELEDLIYHNKEILGDLKIFSRQSRSGDGRYIPDLLAVDDDGKIFIIELKKNEQVGSEAFIQSLHYVNWAKNNPVELKHFWNEQIKKEDDTIVEPDWNNIELSVLLVAPSFDSEVVNLVLNTQEISFRFMTINRYLLDNQIFLLVDQLDELDEVTKRKHIPQSQKEYNWDFYREWFETTKDNIEKAKSISLEVEKIFKDLDIEWLRMKFNKEWISYKNGRYNVVVLYFENDGTPGLEFHIPEHPEKLKLNLPETVLKKGEWVEGYKCFYVPLVRIGIAVEDLKPLFIEAKNFRC